MSQPDEDALRTRLIASGWRFDEARSEQARASILAAQADVLRQHALREWHTNPAKYPREFRWHVEAGDFDDILNPPAPARERGAA